MNGAAAGQMTGESTGSAIGKDQHDPNSLHQGILRELKTDVYKKYDEKEVMGQGSMGHVARVQIRDGTEGGSAFNPKKKPKFGFRTSQDSNVSGDNLSERRKEKVDYALKSIQLDRVKPIFVEELKNEIAILKSMVSSLLLV